MRRIVLNLALLFALLFSVAVNWLVRGDGSQPNREFLPQMAHSPRYNAYAPNPNFADGKTLTLVNGPALAQLVQNVQPGCASPPPIPAAGPSEPGCPKCGSPMVLRTARLGSNAGSQFYGCTRYPQCRGTRPAG